jgi:hypothetical protein
MDPGHKAQGDDLVQDPPRVLNIIKLAVGIDDVDHLIAVQKQRRNKAGTNYHRTRMMPTRVNDIVPGGSMYWVIKGLIQVRQPIIALHKKTEDGKSFCHIEMAPQHILVQATAKRPFQGWRYLQATDAPPDEKKRGATFVDPDMPKELKAELRRLGLL